MVWELDGPTPILKTSKTLTNTAVLPVARRSLARAPTRAASASDAARRARDLGAPRRYSTRAPEWSSIVLPEPERGPMTDLAAALEAAERVADDAALDALYGAPVPRSITKEIDHVSDHYRALIEASPFVVLATVGPKGVDVTPRGDPAGFVRVHDPRTLLLPDRRGNNRVDALRNLVRDPRCSLLFLIPGVGETLRVKGVAEILAGSDLCDAFAMQGEPARAVLRVSVHRAYFQCQKALRRSRLWDAASRADRAALPSAGDILAALDRDFDGAAYDAGYPEHMKRTLY